MRPRRRWMREEDVAKPHENEIQREERGGRNKDRKTGQRVACVDSPHLHIPFHKINIIFHT